MTEVAQELEAALLADPDDQDALLVYADWLLARGEPRGELITLHHQLTREQDPTRVKALREAEASLLERHRDRLLPAALRRHAEHRVRWSNGFIRTLELELPGSLADADLLREILAHPSLRCLTELQLVCASTSAEAVFGALKQQPPPALRVLRLGREGPGSRPGLRLDGIETALPRLELLVLHPGTVWEQPAHPRLRRLELVLAGGMLWNGSRRGPSGPSLELTRLVAARLPALHALRVSGVDRAADARLGQALRSMDLPPLTELVLDRCAGLDTLCTELVASPLLPRLARLELSDSLTLQGAAVLAGASGLRLERLVVEGNQLPNDARSLLEPLCHELVFGWQRDQGGVDLGQDAWYVRHTRRPQWGAGRVVENLGDKLTIEFERAGRRTIAANLPFLESMPGSQVADDSPLRSPHLVRPTIPAPVTRAERAVAALAGATLIRILEGRVRDQLSHLARRGAIDDEERRQAQRTLALLCRDLAALTGASKGRLRTLTLRDARRARQRIDVGLVERDLCRRVLERSGSPPAKVELLFDEDDALRALERLGPALPEDTRLSPEQIDNLLDLLLPRAG